MALPELRLLPSPSSREPAIAIERVDAIGTRTPDWFHHWTVTGSRPARRRRWLSFGHVADGRLLRFHGVADFHVSPAGDAIRCAPTAGCTPITLRHLLLDQVLPLVMSQRGRLVLHASAVHLDGFGTVAFAGAAGLGKSTLATALGRRGGAIVADDSLVVDDRGGVLQAVPGYPGVRLWRDALHGLGVSRPDRVAQYTSKARIGRPHLEFRSRPSPLKAIFMLGPRTRSGTAAHAQPIAARDRLVALTRAAYVMDVTDRHQLTSIFVALAELATRVPVADLRVADDRRRLDAAAEQVKTLALSSQPSADRRTLTADR